MDSSFFRTWEELLKKAGAAITSYLLYV